MKTILILLLTLFFSHSYGNENIDLSELGDHNNFAKKYTAKFFKADFPLFSVDEDHIKNNSCYKNPITQRELNEWFDSTYSANPSQLQADSRELVYKELIEKHGDCNKDNYCILKKYFSESYSKKLLYLFHKYKITASYLKLTNATFVKEDVLDDFMTAVKIVSDYLPKNKPLFFIKPNKLARVGARYDLMEHVIEIHYAEKDTRPFRVYALLHELGHHIERSYNLEKYWESIDEEAKKSSQKIGNLHGDLAKVSEYAKAHIDEDFAENFTAYILFPKNVILRNKMKFKLLKSIVFFNGVDNSEENGSCIAGNNLQYEENNYNEINISSNDQEAIPSKCALFKIRDELFEKSNSSDKTVVCVKNNYLLKSIASSISSNDKVEIPYDIFNYHPYWSSPDLLEKVDVKNVDALSEKLVKQLDDVVYKFYEDLKDKIHVRVKYSSKKCSEEIADLRDTDLIVTYLQSLNRSLIDGTEDEYNFFEKNLAPFQNYLKREQCSN